MFNPQICLGGDRTNDGEAEGVCKWEEQAECDFCVVARRRGNQRVGYGAGKVLFLIIDIFTILQILLFLQQYLDQPVLDYFDWIAATSTGSLIMSTLLTGKFA